MPYKDPEMRRAASRASKARGYANPARRALLLERQADYYRAHKAERDEYQRAWVEINHDKVLAQAANRYRRRDPRERFAYRANRKVAAYGRPHEVLDWRDLPPGPWACTYCGSPCESWDHVEQLARGGANAASNLVPSCLPCNQSRSNRHRQRTAEEAAA